MLELVYVWAGEEHIIFIPGNINWVIETSSLDIRFTAVSNNQQNFIVNFDSKEDCTTAVGTIRNYFASRI